MSQTKEYNSTPLASHSCTFWILFSRITGRTSEWHNKRRS